MRRAIAASALGAVALAVGIIAFISASGPGGPPCPTGKHLIPLVVGKVIVPECM